MLHAKHVPSVQEDSASGDLKDELVVVGIAVGLFVVSVLLFYVIEAWVG